MSNSWEYTESSIFFEWILNQVHSFKNMEHPAKICDDNEEILSFKIFLSKLALNSWQGWKKI